MTQRLDPARTYTVGRDPQSDVVFREAIVSWWHARIYWGGTSWVLQDLNSTNGTYDLGRRISLAEVGHGALLTLGGAAEGPRLRFTVRPARRDTAGGTSVTRIGRAPDNDLVVREHDVSSHHAEFSLAPAGSLIVRRLTVRVRHGKSNRTLLQNVSFEVPAKALIAVVGPSGSGKSTLLRALTGHQPNVKGEVLYDNQNLHERFAELRQHIGIVPQHDILHPQLTVRSALRHAARLRFPRGTEATERDRRVEEVLTELRLGLHADQRIAALSGGQRKRVSVALELLTKPSLMFLDEPTSGLDPGMDRDVMQLLRGLADDGRTVLVVTHSVGELEQCDKVLVLGPGGSLAYFGPPAQALEFFGQATWADVFSAFDEHRDLDWSRRWHECRQHVASAAAPRQTATTAPEAVHTPKPPRWTAQLSVLVRRQLAVMASDRRFVGLMALLPVILGLASTVIPADFGLRRAPDGTPNLAAGTILASLVISVCFMGAANSVRELVKERALYERERAAGLSRSAYLMSKITVLGLISGLQGITLCLLGLVPRELPTEGMVAKDAPLLEMTFVITMLGFTSMMCGLVISSLARTAESTMPLLVLFCVFQYLFSGVTFHLFNNPGVEQVAWLAPSRWAIAAEGVTLDLGPLLGPMDKSAPSATDPLWRHSLSQWLTDMGVLFGLAMGCYALTIRLLRRHEPPVVRRR
ncbi:ATP-binding cassette domain-containing protein [Streptomyces sp. NPDC001816]|uniref:ATP-binding cassette domain-containing protein n=1 Tax=Streptomyces sp. NPDC001816 TaxID=3364612 RepID=UPI0036885E07